MTKKDFILIADVIKSLPYDEYTRRRIAQKFALHLYIKYLKFSTDIFIGHVLGKQNLPRAGR